MHGGYSTHRDILRVIGNNHKNLRNDREYITMPY